MRWHIAMLAVTVSVGLSPVLAMAQGSWGRGGPQGIRPPWNNHSRLQSLGSGSARAAAPESGGTDLSPRGLARSLLWPFGTKKSQPPPAQQLPPQPWPPQGMPAAGLHPTAGFPQAAPTPGMPYTTRPVPGALPGAVQFPAQLPPTAYQMPTSVYHQWTPQQVNPASYQRPYPAGGRPGVVPAQAIQPQPPQLPQSGYPHSASAGTVNTGQPLPGQSIQPQVVGTVDRRQLSKPSWLERLRSLWPFGR